MKKNATKNFYVFTGFDGTLNSSDYLKVNFCNKRARPDSIEALNFLLRTLREHGYNPKLVCTSSLRISYDLMCYYLYESGLDKQEHIGVTKWVEGPRGKKILDYLRTHESKFVEAKNKVEVKMAHMLGVQPFGNYVVIDCNEALIAPYIPEDKCIPINKTVEYLTMEKVQAFLAKQGMSEEQSENV